MHYKRNRKKTTQWNIFFHYFTILYAILSGIVLVPLYLKFLTVDLYGVWLAASNVIAWMSMVDPGLSSVVMQKASVAYGRQDMAALNGLFTNGMVLSLLLGLLVAGSGWLAAPYLMTWLNLEATAAYSQLPPAFLMAVLGTALMIFSYGISAFNQGLQSSLGIGLVFVFSQLGSLILTVWLFYRGWGLMALAAPITFRGLSLLFGNLAYLAWRTMADGLRLRPSLAGFRELIRLTSFTFLGKVMGTIANSMDSLIVTRYLGPELAPVYTLTRKVPDLSRTFLERPAMAFMPAIGSLAGEGNIDRVREVSLRLLRMMLWSMGLAVVGFWLLNGAFIKMWVGSTLYAGCLINGLVIGQMIIIGFGTALYNLSYALGNIQGNSMASVAYGLITIPLMLAGVHYQGLLGVALAQFVAAFLVTSCYYPRVFVRLVHLRGGEIRGYLREIIYVSAVATLIASVFNRWADPSDWWEFSAVTLAIAVGYVLTLYLLSSAFRQECRGAWQRLRRSSQ